MIDQATKEYNIEKAEEFSNNLDIPEFDVKISKASQVWWQIPINPSTQD